MPKKADRSKAEPDSQDSSGRDETVDRQFATTLAKGLEILRCFTPEEPYLANRDLVARSGLPKATVSRFTYTLTRLGYLRVHPRTGAYQLGSAVLSLGYPLLGSMPQRQIARPAMHALAEDAQGSVSLGIRDRLDIVYIETSRSRSLLSTSIADVGTSHPIVASAIGRAYLCALTLAERTAVINEIQVKRPEQWKQHAKEVQASIDDYHRYRFCVSRGELLPDIHAVAAPLRRYPNSDIVVMNCVIQSSLLRPGQLEQEIGPRLASLVQSLDVVSR